ncbi:MAG: hypothetical protein LBM74_00350 [Oscillospiraceae bacterium]|jgi:surface polysaccharide O-acyltransferase-like enzyme|nr:hypothetical protein [Oscillospiraceae bacterium]
MEAASWLAILMLLGMGRHYLNFTTRAGVYLAHASFFIYLFHQSILVVLAFFIFQLSSRYWVQMPAIVLGTFVFSFLLYEVMRRISVMRWMFGLKKP